MCRESQIFKFIKQGQESHSNHWDPFREYVGTLLWGITPLKIVPKETNYIPNFNVSLEIRVKSINFTYDFFHQRSEKIYSVFNQNPADINEPKSWPFKYENSAQTLPKQLQNNFEKGQKMTFLALEMAKITIAVGQILIKNLNFRDNL